MKVIPSRKSWDRYVSLLNMAVDKLLPKVIKCCVNKCVNKCCANKCCVNNVM